MSRQPQNTAGFFIFILMIWMIFPDTERSAETFLLSDLAGERIQRFWTALHVLGDTRWGDFAPTKEQAKWVNLTGFRQEDGLSWGGLDHFRQRSLDFSRYAFSAEGEEQLWDSAEALPVWTNASGTLHGEWHKTDAIAPRSYASHNLSASMPDIHWVGDDAPWARNMTGREGRMVVMLEGNTTDLEYEQLSVDEAPLSGGSVRSIKANVQIEDTHGSHHNWEMRLWGAHWPRKGVVMLTTTSEKFQGLFGLPHLTPGADYFRSSQMLLNETLAHTLKTKERDIYVDPNQPWSSDVDNSMYTKYPYPHCEFVMYGQLQPPTRQSVGLTKPESEREALANMIHAAESELEAPVGAPLGSIPDMQMSAVIYSPDCGFFLETKGPPDFPPGQAHHLLGLKKEIHLQQVKKWLLVFALVVSLQVWLLRRQRVESSTPSTMARVSFSTMGMMLLVDGMTFTAAATWVSSAASTFLPTLVLMFSSFLSMTVGGAFLGNIHDVQLPEGRDRRDRNQQVNGASGANDATADAQPAVAPTGTQQGGAESLLPAPVTAGRPANTVPDPVIVPSDQDIDAEIAEGAAAAPLVGANQQRAEARTPVQSFQSIVGRFILLSLTISFLIISSTTWYPSWRSGFLNALGFIYLSLWVPQIYRNTMRNCRRALKWEFVLGQSVLRLLPLAYFWVKEDNFLYASPEPRAFLVMCTWLWVQIVILAAQDIVGPRFGVPVSWTPDAWDYHPILREDSLEAGGLPIGLVMDDHPGLADSEETKKNHNTRTIDCSICREHLEVPVIKSGNEASGVTGALARRLYMVTPCRHIFHTACLEGWMRFRLQCPICREELPPL
ncbi:uncharacterized protein F5Z01DRAFT_652881 [Emericellopsis atlantica]|uniref:DSC E3 ubiquitin ligase complex subunit A n=1 Tax=Emericellopsis atlantica TaxID=2614577 RepID=A0A9P7ZPH9_9HYPO|nr:uncharacterized protein F5Z01DRAFT_652881 [Emericellopsis atlantica]KAG9255350.1 hypothetical protein F5Z01DRAFT_652881 [Emericellopsis atlantica]